MVYILEGIRVLDLSRLLPGPFCTQLLSDLGAEVIKVESKEGDGSRYLRTQVRGFGTSFLMLNRGKKSMTLDLKSRAGVEVLRRLAAGSDMLVESFRPGVVERLGISYEKLKSDNPRLIYLSLTGYGQDGPYCQRAGHDLNFSSFSGLASLTGPRKGKPVPLAIQAGDIAGGALMAAFALMAALFHREHSGRGQYIDVAMMDGLMCLGQSLYGEYISRGSAPGPGEMRLSGGYPVYDIYETRDGKYVSIGALEEKFWENFCDKVGREDLKPMHHTGWDKDRDRLSSELEALFKTRTRDEWTELLADEDTCCSPVLGLDEALHDPHVMHRNMVEQGPHPDGGPLSQVSFPVKFSDAEPAPLRAAPRLGEHTHEVLASAGYEKEEVEELKEKGVV